MVKKYSICFEEMIGVIGYWYKSQNGNWYFQKEAKVNLTENDMKYLLKKLKKIRNSEER